MAGRGRAPHMLRGPMGGPGMRQMGMRPMGPGIDGLPPSPALVEEKLATQHAEIQRLLTENQRLAATHIALRQELAATQQEVQRLQQMLAGMQAEKEQQFRGITEKCAKMEADLRTLEPLKAELQRAQADAQKFLGTRQELSAQVQQLTQELHRSHADVQLVPTMKADMETIRQEVQRARTAFEFEKKANTELLEQRGAMEKNLVSMAREVEKLRADLTNSEKKARTSGYGGGYGPDSAYSSVPAYGDGYGMGQIAGAGENGVPFGAATVPSWGAYEMQRGGVPHARR